MNDEVNKFLLVKCPCFMPEDLAEQQGNIFGNQPVQKQNQQNDTGHPQVITYCIA
jgi:hypothetical protein